MRIRIWAIDEGIFALREVLAGAERPTGPRDYHRSYLTIRLRSR